MSILSIVGCVMFGGISVVLLNELSRPVPTTTRAVDEVFGFNTYRRTAFELGFHAPYRLDLNLHNHAENDTAFHVRCLLKKNGEVEFDSIYQQIGNHLPIVVYFGGVEGDDCELVLSDRASTNYAKSANLIVDVNNGAPSVGLVYQRAMRPYLKIALAVFIGCFVISVFSLLKHGGN